MWVDVYGGEEEFLNGALNSINVIFSPQPSISNGFEYKHAGTSEPRDAEN